jgi:hypothetical protein
MVPIIPLKRRGESGDPLDTSDVGAPRKASTDSDPYLPVTLKPSRAIPDADRPAPSDTDR